MELTLTSEIRKRTGNKNNFSCAALGGLKTCLTHWLGVTALFFPNPLMYICDSLTDGTARIIFIYNFPYQLMLRPGFEPTSVSRVAPTWDP